VTIALIPPVILRRPAAGSRPRGTPAVVRTLPLAAPPELVPALCADVVDGLGRIDASGRVADRTVTSALGWHGGERLTLTACAGVVTAHRDPHGLAVLPPRHCIVIPAPLRHRCGLLPGDPVLLASRPAEDTLTRTRSRWSTRPSPRTSHSRHVREETDDDHRT
jgi:hypothetical protein